MDLDDAVEVDFVTAETADHDEINFDLESPEDKGNALADLISNLNIPDIQITDCGPPENGGDTENTDEHVSEQTTYCPPKNGGEIENTSVLDSEQKDASHNTTDDSTGSYDFTQTDVDTNSKDNKENSVVDDDRSEKNETDSCQKTDPAENISLKTEQPLVDTEQSCGTELVDNSCPVMIDNAVDDAEKVEQSEENHVTESVSGNVTSEVDPSASFSGSIAVTGDVSIDSIIVLEKQESDSDAEFDFELPTSPAAKQTEAPSTAAVSKIEVSKPQSTDTTSKVTEKTSVPQSLASTSLATRTPPVVGASSSATAQKPVAVIKPSAQTQDDSFLFSQCPTDASTQQVLEAAQNEWDNVTTIQAGYKEQGQAGRGAEATVVETVKPMSVYELTQIFMQENFSSVKGKVKSSVDRRGLAAFVNLLFGPPKLHRNLIEERERVFCIAATQLENENESHIRTLQTIYRSLTGSKFDCSRTGSHWEEIGFQGNDPATDLRGAGVLGLMNLLFILKDPKKQALASEIYRLSLHPTQNFPFCVMGINLSRITLQTLREDLLNKECNRRGSVLEVVNDFYTGLYLQMYQVWKSQGKTISDSGYVIKDIEIRAKKNTKDVFKNLEDYLNKKSTVVIEKDMEPGADNFTNVCED